MMTDDDEGSVVSVVTSVVTCVQPADFRQVEDEVNREDEEDEVDREEEVDEVDRDEEVDEVMEVDEIMEEEGEDQSEDYQFGGNHPMRMGSLLSKRFNENDHHKCIKLNESG